MRRYIIMGVLFVLVASSGVAASALLHIGPFANLLGPAHRVAKQAQTAAPPSPPAKVQVGSFSIPIIAEHQLQHLVGIDVELSVAPTKVGMVTNGMPKLRDAFTMALLDLIPVQADVHSAATKKAIHDRLTRAAEKVYGKGVVLDVRIKGIYDR